MKKTVSTALLFSSTLFFAQENSSKIKASFFEGIVVAGYVDHGAFINFTGPNISFNHKSTKVMLGMLPSLRIKEDKSSGTKNSAITPNLGVGIAAVYKKIVLQIPLYYNSKTATQNGNWKVGVGLGYSFR
ncbi:hypothetical protein NZ698_01570 [Chryseobacterium sp. PBS4-4]|uniref:Outer membrane protein beta-barrel domain-containing protein n=1 Tax=Chryseobacterium edaphi TaxID=2976532 RepID=A0ABT2W3R5_9FLAO|nr:hypothetical protein [Chryseobacterium edaphi]MCU7615872.1 hypothetical protein [Chryseobacterium edaphi]